MDKTIEYYNQNADMFAQGTRLVDFTVVQERFAKMLPVDSRILDFGCGSGRDTKYFLEKGYRVEATDGSSELCKLAMRVVNMKASGHVPLFCICQSRNFFP